ncbi:uncharacterized protein LOC120074407 isoform X1 [Benincasa hispida]|uniref:uncharacterized protein LOC120074407 isoform X1 n=1 Tax=Benincasa hispida TaxID=102211 RepID=UPI001902BEB8|nr:uncharacterized protein LOC120074407 isoform X1 [Benincasa hispida]
MPPLISFAQARRSVCRLPFALTRRRRSCPSHRDAPVWSRLTSLQTPFTVQPHCPCSRSGQSSTGSTIFILSLPLDPHRLSLAIFFFFLFVLPTGRERDREDKWGFVGVFLLIIIPLIPLDISVQLDNIINYQRHLQEQSILYSKWR